MKHIVILTTSLVILWFCFSGYFTFFPMVPGLVAIIVIVCTLMITDVLLGSLRYRFTVPFFFLVGYIPWILWQIFLSSIHVARVALLGRASPTLITMLNPTATAQGLTILANSITLTPGTFVFYADSDTFIIHALTIPDAPKDFNEIMNNRVLLLERVKG